MSWIRLLSLLSLCVLSYACNVPENTNAIENLFNWIKEKGGELPLESKLNANGVRGLFSLRDVEAGGVLANIPSTTVMNLGFVGGPVESSILGLLRELKNNCTRFRPYLDYFPKPSEVLNLCNLDMKYASMWKVAYWKEQQVVYYEFLRYLLNEKNSLSLDETLSEALGDIPVTIEDLEYACALATSRFVECPTRRRLLLIPIFDLNNHRRNCTHTLVGDSRGWSLVAGENVAAGEELCYAYGNLRDDTAVSLYGFLPELESPPRLALVDHHLFVDSWHSTNADLPDFQSDDPAVVSAELSRLWARLSELRATPDEVSPPPPGQPDRIYDLFKELERRRDASLVYEIERVTLMLSSASAEEKTRVSSDEL